jgi:hypothetical protein
MVSEMLLRMVSFDAGAGNNAYSDCEQTRFYHPALLDSHVTKLYNFFILPSQAFFGLGTGGLQIQIRLTGTPETHPYDIFYLRHRPSWKLRKSAFTTLKSHGINSDPTISPGDGGPQRIMVYSCDHDTEGEVTLSMAHGKKLDHMGIQVKFFGRIDMVGSFGVFGLIFLLKALNLTFNCVL